MERQDEPEKKQDQGFTEMVDACDMAAFFNEEFFDQGYGWVKVENGEIKHVRSGLYSHSHKGGEKTWKRERYFANIACKHGLFAKPSKARPWEYEYVDPTINNDTKPKSDACSALQLLLTPFDETLLQDIYRSEYKSRGDICTEPASLDKKNPDYNQNYFRIIEILNEECLNGNKEHILRPDYTVRFYGRDRNHPSKNKMIDADTIQFVEDDPRFYERKEPFKTRSFSHS